MTIALIQNSIVVNVVTWDGKSSWNPGPQFTQIDVTNLCCSDGTGIEPGCIYNGTNFSQPLVSLTEAIENNIAQFQIAAQQFVDSHYSLEDRFNFMALYTIAIQQGLTNRAAYITQLFIWAESIISYSTQYCAMIQAATSVAQINATYWDFTQIIDPLITPLAAIQISN